MPGASLPAVDLARARLAAELACDSDEIALVQVEAVEWRDSSLGCPQPGMMYMQVITPGYRITLARGGQQYVYHTDQGRRAVRCEHPHGPASRAFRR